MKEEALPKKSRLLKAKQFQTVFKKPKKFFSKETLIVVRPNETSESRLGLVVKKKGIKQAVKRNAMKRVTRESFRKNKRFFCVGLDVVVIVHRFIPKSDLSDHLETQWKKVFKFHKKS